MAKVQETHGKSVGPIETVLNAVANLVSRKNATPAQENTDVDVADSADASASASAYAETLRKLVSEKQGAQEGHDPAHAPGHRKLHRDGSSALGGKIQQSASVLNNNAKSDLIHKSETQQRGDR